VRVLLADPPQMFLTGQGHTRHILPLGIAYVGAMLDRAGHDVRMLLPDVRAYTGDDPWGELARAIESERPRLLGITAVTATFPAAAKLAAIAKGVNPEVVTVLGGTHASADPRGALAAAPAIDYVVQGEGEHAMVEIARVLETGGIERVAGVGWRGPMGIVVNPSAPAIEALEDLPLPLRDPKHLVWSEGLHPTLFQALITLRGCPYRCIYCAVPQSVDRKTRYRSPASVVDEIEVLRGVYDVPGLFFHDSVFSMHRARTVAICDGMVERGLAVPFTCQTRTDRVDGELLDTMVRAGCEQIFFGIESGDVESLRKIRKAMPLESIRAAVELVKARGIRCSGFFMVGFPWEDELLIVARARRRFAVLGDALAGHRAVGARRRQPHARLDRLPDAAGQSDAAARRRVRGGVRAREAPHRRVQPVDDDGCGELA
jgi:anaerobic magnesium-protoporphyrin IX monomethyl ester cyclase